MNYDEYKLQTPPEGEAEKPTCPCCLDEAELYRVEGEEKEYCSKCINKFDL